MRGRKPHPTWRKALEGNPGKRAPNTREPEFPAPAPSFDQIPIELEGNARAAAEWQRIAPTLRQARQITDADRAALLALCTEWSKYLEATAKLGSEGMIVHSPNGFPMPSPYISIARGALAACSRIWPELGMTPSSRSRVKTDGPEPDAFSEFDQPYAARRDGPGRIS